MFSDYSLQCRIIHSIVIHQQISPLDFYSEILNSIIIVCVITFCRSLSDVNRLRPLSASLDLVTSNAAGGKGKDAIPSHLSSPMWSQQKRNVTLILYATLIF